MAEEEKFLFDAEIGYTSTGVGDILAEAGQIEDTINGISGDVDIGVNVDDSGLDNLLSLEDSAFDVSIDATIVDDSDISELNSLEDLNPDVDIAATLTDDTDVQEVEDLDGATVSPEIDTKETEEGKAVVNKLDEIRKLQVIQIAIDVIGTALDFIKSWEDFAAGPLLTIDQKVAQITAQTGEAIPNLDELLKGLVFDDLGDANVVGDVVLKAQQLGAPLEEAARAALTFTHTFVEENPKTVLDTINQMVKSDLVPNFQAGADLLVAGFQNGDNAAGDLLSTLYNNATAFSDLGLNGQQSLSLIKTGLDNGFASAGDVATALTTFKKNLTTGGEDVDSFLKSIGLDNPTKTGGEIGPEFLAAVIEGIKNAPDTGALSQDELEGKLFGKQGLKNASAVLGLSTDVTAFDDVAGAADKAATQADDSFTGAIDDFKLKLQEVATDFLSSEQIDLPGKLEAIKTGLQDALSIIESGGTVGEAIEIGLNIPGFNDSVGRFESTVGNFAISVLEIVAGIQDFLGKDSTGTRQQITQLERQQLPFDLKLANADEIGGVFQSAINRGLSTADIADATKTSFGELLAGGDIAKAQALIDSLKTVAEGPPILAPNLTGEQITEAQVALRMADNGDTSRIQEQLDKGNLIAPVSIDTGSLQEQVNAAAQVARDGLNKAFAEGDITAGIEFAKQLGDQQALDQLNAIAADYKAQFKTALESGDLGTAADFGAALPDDTEIQKLAVDNVDKFKAAFNDALASGDTTTAGNIANLLDDEALQAQVDKIKGLFSTSKGDELGGGLTDRVKDLGDTVKTASDDVGTASDDMSSDVSDATDSIHDDLVGHSVTTDFEAVGTAANLSADAVNTALQRSIASIIPLETSADQLLSAAQRDFGGVGLAADQLYGKLAHLNMATGLLGSLRSEVDALYGSAQSLLALLATGGAGGGGGTTTNNNKTVTVNQTNYNQSAAQTGSSNQQLLNQIGGGIE